MVDDIFQSFIIQVQSTLNFIVMLFGELVEVFGEHINGLVYISSTALLALQLQQQAFLQIACPNAGRVELLHQPDDLLYLMLIGLDILTERKVIYNGHCFATQVSIIIDTAYDLLRDPALFIA